MRRYWIPQDAIVTQADGTHVVQLNGETLHHIRDVCRMRIGSKFEVLTESSQAHFVEITQETKHESIAKIIETRTIAPLPKPHLHLAISVPKFATLEAVLEKAVELGVSRVHPFYSDFSFVRKEDGTLEKKRPRWEKIILSATQQSGRGELMPLNQAQPLDKILATFNQSGHSAGLFAYEGAGQLHAKEALRQLRQANPAEVWLFVGGEGGFSDKEVEKFQQVNLRPTTLGSQVLRVETACLALLSIIKYDFDQMRAMADSTSSDETS